MTINLFNGLVMQDWKPDDLRKLMETRSSELPYEGTDTLGQYASVLILPDKIIVTRHKYSGAVCVDTYTYNGERRSGYDYSQWQTADTI